VAPIGIPGGLDVSSVPADGDGELAMAVNQVGLMSDPSCCWILLSSFGRRKGVLLPLTTGR
jgi:hypothetical protein